MDYSLGICFVIALRLISASDICQNAQKCDCFANLGEIHCPDKYTQYYVITVKETATAIEEIKVDCNVNIDRWDFYKLPFLNISYAKRVAFNSCPFGAQGVSKLGVAALGTLAVSHTHISGVATLKKTHFFESANLTSLWLQSNQIDELEPGVFQRLPQLEELNLRQNYIQKFNGNIFQTESNLQILDLSANSLVELGGGCFRKARNLKDLNLSNNQLRRLPEEVLSNLKYLRIFEVSNNELETIPDGFFKDNEQLESVDVSWNGFSTLPNGTLSNLPSLKLVKLNNCQLVLIPEDIFRNSTGITYVDMSANNLSQIPNIFRNLTQLKVLDLGYNSISALAQNFGDLRGLKELNLENNKISSIDAHTFWFNSKLTYIDLSSNVLTSKAILGRLDACLDLEEVFLGHNRIKDIPLGHRHRRLRVLDVSSNRFNKLDFNISNPGAEVDFSSNKVDECACGVFHALSANVSVKTNFHCSDLSYDIEETKLEVATFVCTVNHIVECPSDCTCTMRPFDTTLVVNCNSLTLEDVPDLTAFQNSLWNQTEVLLESNLVGAGPTPGMGYENVVKLHLTNNLLRELHWVPPNIKVLRVDFNHITHIDSSVLDVLSEPGLQSVSLENNPWRCDCDSAHLVKFVRNNTKLRGSKVMCRGTQALVANLDLEGSCRPKFLEISLGVLAVLLLIVVIAKVARTCCQKPLPKEYDVFISYSHKDQKLVASQLIPFLEEACKLSVCVHFRDWEVGKFIPKQITESILKSRVTLVVLSENFLDSVWGKMELRTAHCYSKQGNKAKVVVVTLDGLDLQNCPKHLKSYTKNKTIIKWEEASFWLKLENTLKFDCVQIV